jgi:hypothetical protein
MAGSSLIFFAATVEMPRTETSFGEPDKPRYAHARFQP